MQLVPRSIPVQFRQPPLATIRGRSAILTALMPVPKAAMDEDRGFVFRQQNIH